MHLRITRSVTVFCGVEAFQCPAGLFALVVMVTCHCHSSTFIRGVANLHCCVCVWMASV